MTAPNETSNESTSSAPCVVMVLYEDDAALRQAMTACDHLTRSQWANVDFEFHWWRTQFLNDPDLAAGAAEQAAGADVFIVCSGTATEPPHQLRLWFEDWAPRRAGRPGALASLSTTTSPDAPRRHASETLLRELCKKVKLDFLGSFPPAANATR